MALVCVVFRPSRLLGRARREKERRKQESRPFRKNSLSHSEKSDEGVFSLAIGGRDEGGREGGGCDYNERRNRATQADDDFAGNCVRYDNT